MTNYRHVKVADIRKGMKRPYWDYQEKTEKFRAISWWDIYATDYKIRYDDGVSENFNGESRITVVDDGSTDTQTWPATRTIGIHEAEVGMEYVFTWDVSGYITRTIMLATRRVLNSRTEYTLNFSDGTTYSGNYGTTIAILDK